QDVAREVRRLRLPPPARERRPPAARQGRGRRGPSPIAGGQSRAGVRLRVSPHPGASMTPTAADVVIVGGGGAGVAAALEAAEAGARVVLLEQDAALGGTAATSGAGCFIVGTPLQEPVCVRATPRLALDA